MEKMSCKLCFEFNENSLKFSSDVAVKKNIAQILRKHFTFCFKEGDVEGSVCEKCWWKVEIFDSFYNSIEFLHRNIIFADALTKFSQDDQLHEPQSDISALKVDGPDCPEQHRERQESDDESSSHSKRNIHSGLLHSKASFSEVRQQFKIKSTLCQSQQRTKRQRKKCTNSWGVQTKPGNLLGHPAAKFQCTEPECTKKKIYSTQHQLDRHKRYAHCEVQCDLCHKTYRKYYLAKHTKNVHSNQIETVCDICGMGCKTNDSYKAHYATMHTKQQKVQCDNCKMWLKNKNCLRRHYVTIHLDSNPVICLICGHTAPNKKALDSHQRIHRPNYKSFICTVCDKAFPNKFQLHEHMSTHSNIREKLKCKRCCREFNSKAGFQHHMCTTPTERNFKCPYCDRTYSYSSGVRTHIGRIHRAEEDRRKATIKMIKLSNLEKIKNTFE